MPGSSGTAITEAIKIILTGIRYLGVGIAIIAILFISIKYLMSTAEGRADIKGYLINWSIGVFVLVGASGILKIIQNIIG